MVSVQRSIEIRVPVHTLYSQLTQFEDYPQFMQDIEAVEQRDDTHLHWKARMMDQAVEWDAIITERVPDQCIVWKSENGPGNTGKVELQSVGPAASRLTLTMVSEMDFEPTTPAGDIKAEFSERIWEDLTRLRALVEDRQQQDRLSMQAEIQGSRNAVQGANMDAGQEAGPVAELGVAQGAGQAGNRAGRGGIDEVARQGSVEGMAQGNTGTMRQASSSQNAVDSLQRDRGSPGNPVPASGYAAGSEGFSGSEDPGSPVLSASQTAQRNKPEGSDMDAKKMKAEQQSRGQPDKPTQSDYSLSKESKGEAWEEPYSIAEEVNFDQQSDFARHVGQLSTDDVNGANEGMPNQDVIAKAAQRKRPEPEV